LGTCVDVFFADAGFGEGEVEHQWPCETFRSVVQEFEAYVQASASRCCSRLPIGDT
jgi:hypothetical protein